MPSGPIQSGTAGLLSLLEVKNLGRNPDSLLDAVTPTLEMVPWWLRAQSVPYQAADVADGAGAGSMLAFGASEKQWIYLHHASYAVQIPLTLGTELFSLDVVSLGTGQGVYFDSQRLYTAAGIDSSPDRESLRARSAGGRHPEVARSILRCAFRPMASASAAGTARRVIRRQCAVQRGPMARGARTDLRAARAAP